MHGFLKTSAILMGSIAVLGSACLPGSGVGPGGGGLKAVPGVEPSGIAGPSGAGGSVAAADGRPSGSGAAGESGDDLAPQGGAPDVVSDTPIVVSGLPLGSTPGPHCSPIGTQLFFEPAQMAVTGVVDALGRREILIKTAVYSRVGSQAPEPLGEQYVWFGPPEAEVVDLTSRYGSSASWNGCVFAKAYAPPSSVPQVIRLFTSVLVCAPERPDEAVGELDTFAMRRLPSSGSPVGPGGLSGGPSVAKGILDVTLPRETVESALEGCGERYLWDELRDRAVVEEALKHRLEKAQENSSQTGSPSWKDFILQRAR